MGYPKIYSSREMSLNKIQIYFVLLLAGLDYETFNVIVH